MAKTSNTMILPANANDAAGMAAQAMAVYQSVHKASQASAAAGSDSGPAAFLDAKGDEHEAVVDEEPDSRSGPQA